MHTAKKRVWGTLSRSWVPLAIRDDVVSFVRRMHQECGASICQLCSYIEITPQRFADWQKRVGTENRHNCRIPRKNQVLPEERRQIVSFYQEHREDGYRRCAYMMMDQNLVAVSPSTFYNVLREADALRKFPGYANPNRGKGFHQPLKAHDHWHIDFTYIHVGDTLCFLVTVIDGWSRCILASYLSEKIDSASAQIAIEMAHEKYPEARPRIISDNGKQFTGKEFVTLLGIHGFTYARTSPYYPQSNGKIERWHKSLKLECVRCKAMATFEHAAEIIAAYVAHYNFVRLHSAIGFIAPMSMLNGERNKIFEERKRKLEEAQLRRNAAKIEGYSSVSGEAEAGNTGEQPAEEYPDCQGLEPGVTGKTSPLCQEAVAMADMP